MFQYGRKRQRISTKKKRCVILPRCENKIPEGRTIGCSCTCHGSYSTGIMQNNHHHHHHGLVRRATAVTAASNSTGGSEKTVTTRLSCYAQPATNTTTTNLPLTIHHHHHHHEDVQVFQHQQHPLWWQPRRRKSKRRMQLFPSFQRRKQPPSAFRFDCHYGWANQTNLRSLSVKHSGLGLFSILMVILLCCWRCMAPVWTIYHQSQPFIRGSRQRHNQTIPLLVQHHLIPFIRSEQHLPLEPDAVFQENARWIDYGGLEIMILLEEGVARSIYHDFEMDQGMPLPATKASQHGDSNNDDNMDAYYAFDDDVKRRSPYYLSSPDDALAHEKRCRRTNWHRLVFPTCNLMHELSMAYNVPKYLR